MANSAMPANSGANNAFDAIKAIRSDGTEYWSARELMPALGYPRWAEFQRPIERAMKSAEVQGHNVENLFRVSPKKTGGRPQQDFELSRFAAYLVAMNGDPNKAEVAAAQAYFAIRTREAETRPAVDAASLTRLELIEMAYNAETERLQLEAKNKELTPKAEAYDEFMDATGHYNVGTVAKMLGKSQNWLFRELRNRGVLISKGAMKNTPYQQYMHHFEVKAHYYERSNGEQGVSHTTYVQPSGIDFIRRKLGLPTIDPLPIDPAA